MKDELSTAQKKLDEEIVRLSKITKRKLKLINSNDSYQFIKLKDKLVLVIYQKLKLLLLSLEQFF